MVYIEGRFDTTLLARGMRLALPVSLFDSTLLTENVRRQETAALGVVNHTFRRFHTKTGILSLHGRPSQVYDTFNCRLLKKQCSLPCAAFRRSSRRCCRAATRLRWRKLPTAWLT